jgi:hypothetical protein
MVEAILIRDFIDEAWEILRYRRDGESDQGRQSDGAGREPARGDVQESHL